MKKLFLLILLSLGLTSISYGGYLDDWTDDQLCGWMDNPSPPDYMVAEVKERGLSCGDSHTIVEQVVTKNSGNESVPKEKPENSYRVKEQPSWRCNTSLGERFRKALSRFL